MTCHGLCLSADLCTWCVICCGLCAAASSHNRSRSHVTVHMQANTWTHSINISGACVQLLQEVYSVTPCISMQLLQATTGQQDIFNPGSCKGMKPQHKLLRAAAPRMLCYGATPLHCWVAHSLLTSYGLHAATTSYNRSRRHVQSSFVQRHDTIAYCPQGSCLEDVMLQCHAFALLDCASLADLLWLACSYYKLQ